MKIINLIHTIALTILFACNLKLATGQATSAGPFTTAPNQPNIPGIDYLGWNNTVNVPLMIRHDNNQSIDFYTDGATYGLTRMTITPGDPALGGGRVGIGYGLNPGYQLDVKSEIHIRNASQNRSYMIDNVSVLQKPGINNTFVGENTGTLLTGGVGLDSKNNTLVGTNAGAFITTGYNNTLLGSDAGSVLTNQFYNTLIGNLSGSLSTGVENT